jgi:hypothetical protein
MRIYAPNVVALWVLVPLTGCLLFVPVASLPCVEGGDDCPPTFPRCVSARCIAADEQDAGDSAADGGGTGEGDGGSEGEGAGDPAADGVLEVPGELATIAEAIEAAPPNITIRLTEAGSRHVGELTIDKPVRIEALEGATLTSSSASSDKTINITENADGTRLVNLIVERQKGGGAIIAQGDVVIEGCEIIGDAESFGVMSGTDASVTILSSVIKDAKVGLDADADGSTIFVANTFFLGGPDATNTHGVKLRAGTTGTFVHNTVLTTTNTGIHCEGSPILVDRSVVAGARDPITGCQHLEGTLVFRDATVLKLDAAGRPTSGSMIIDAVAPKVGDPPELAVDFDGDVRDPAGRTDAGADEVEPDACTDVTDCQICAANPCPPRVCGDDCAEVCLPESSCTMEANDATNEHAFVMTCIGTDSCTLNCNNATYSACLLTCAAGAVCDLDCKNVQDGSCALTCDETSTCTQSCSDNSPDCTMECSSNLTETGADKSCSP